MVEASSSMTTFCLILRPSRKTKFQNKTQKVQLLSNFGKRSFNEEQRSVWSPVAFPLSSLGPPCLIARPTGRLLGSSPGVDVRLLRYSARLLRFVPPQSQVLQEASLVTLAEKYGGCWNPHA